jgi:hypothetical protein
MALRVLSNDEMMQFLDRAKAFHEGNVAKPAYIDAWQAKIDEATMRIAAGLEQKLFTEGDDTFKQFVRAHVEMRHKKDRLYGYWMENKPYRSWDELATGTMPTADELFFLAVIETEDYFTVPHGIATFVHHLDQVHVPGVMKDFVQACLRDCDALLAEEVALTPEIMRTFMHPEQAFGTSVKEVLEERLYNWCRNTIPHRASSHVQRLFIANVMVAQGNFLSACMQMEYARAEAAEPRFAEYMTTGNKASGTYIEAAQRWMIDMLFSVWHRGA